MVELKATNERFQQFTAAAKQKATLTQLVEQKAMNERFSSSLRL